MTRSPSEGTPAASVEGTTPPSLRELAEIAQANGYYHHLAPFIAALREAQEDTRRLSELERMTLAWVDEECASEKCVEVTAPCHIDHTDCDDGCDIASREWLWECIGPMWARGGRSSGQGNTLRAAIDDAIAKQSEPHAVAYASRAALDAAAGSTTP